MREAPRLPEPAARAAKSCKVMSRKVKNQRLAAVGYVWAFVSLTRSPGARAHYDRRRAAGDRHVAAQRNLFNRFMGTVPLPPERSHLRRSNRLPTALNQSYLSGSLTLIRVGCLVTADAIRSAAGSARSAPPDAQALQHRDEHRAVAPLARRGLPGQRPGPVVGQQMDLAGQSAS